MGWVQLGVLQNEWESIHYYQGHLGYQLRASNRRRNPPDGTHPKGPTQWDPTVAGTQMLGPSSWDPSAGTQHMGPSH